MEGSTITMTNSKHAVITDDFVFALGGGQIFLSRPARHAIDLETLARRTGITHFWIMPDTQAAQMRWEFLRDVPDYKIFIPGDKDLERPPTSAVIKRKSEGKGGLEVYIEYPAASKWVWACDTHTDVLETLQYLSIELPDVEIAYSPQHMGKDKLWKLYSPTKRLQGYIRKPETDLQGLHFRQSAPEIFFVGDNPQLQAGDWVHGFDKSSAHPCAAASMVTGCGDPVHVEKVQETDLKPGIYRVSFDVNGSLYDGKGLPLAIESEWVTRDVLKFAMQQGYSVEIHEGYIFEESHRIFETWVHDLYTARQRLQKRLQTEENITNEVARENALDTVKSVLNFSISAMKLHPNWWADMVGLARVARLANLGKFAEAGQRPLYVYVDDMAFISREKEPGQAVPGILDRQGKLGGYRCKYSVQLTEEIIQKCESILRRGDRRQASLLLHGYFKAIAAKQGVING